MSACVRDAKAMIVCMPSVGSSRIQISGDRAACYNVLVRSPLPGSRTRCRQHTSNM